MQYSLCIDYRSFDNMEKMLENEGIICSSMNSCDDIITSLTNDISDAKAVILWVDCYYAPSRKDMYQKVHWPHTWVIYGYNLEKKYFMTLDHTSKDSLNYKKINLSFEEVATAYNGFIDNENNRNDKISYFTFSRFDDIQNVNRIKENYIKNSVRIMVKNMTILSDFISHIAYVAENSNLFMDSAEKISGEINIISWEYHAIYIKYEYILGADHRLCYQIMNTLESLKKLQALLFKAIFTSKFENWTANKTIELCKKLKEYFDSTRFLLDEFETED